MTTVHDASAEIRDDNESSKPSKEEPSNHQFLQTNLMATGLKFKTIQMPTVKVVLQTTCHRGKGGYGRSGGAVNDDVKYLNHHRKEHSNKYSKCHRNETAC